MMVALRVLIMERDGALASQVAALLEEAGFDVAKSADLHDGLKKLYEACPDLIIAGTDLPKVNGENALLQLRLATYVPILALGHREETVEALELGMDGFITRPPGARELVARVRSLLRRKQMFTAPGAVRGRNNGGSSGGR